MAAEIELTRTPGDRKVYTLQGVGTLRLHGWLSRSATARAGEREWEISRRGLFSATMEAVDAAGTVVGAFRGRAIRRGGALRWGDREYVLRPASRWRERYALVDGERELAVFDGKGWGKRPVAMIIEDATAVEPGLLLFCAYVVRRLAEDAGSAAGGASSAAAASA